MAVGVVGGGDVCLNWHGGEGENGLDLTRGVWPGTVVGGNECDMSVATGKAAVPLYGRAKTCRGLDVEATRVELGSELAIDEVAGKSVISCVLPRAATSCEEVCRW